MSNRNHLMCCREIRNYRSLDELSTGALRHAAWAMIRSVISKNPDRISESMESLRWVLLLTSNDGQCRCESHRVLPTQEKDR